MGPLGEEKGGESYRGWAVCHQPGTSVDEHSHHKHQRGISKSVRGGSLHKQKGRVCKEGWGKLTTDIVHKM
jgi:hypothetical protein